MYFNTWVPLKKFGCYFSFHWKWISTSANYCHKWFYRNCIISCFLFWYCSEKEANHWNWELFAWILRLSKWRKGNLRSVFRCSLNWPKWVVKKSSQKSSVWTWFFIQTKKEQQPSEWQCVLNFNFNASLSDAKKPDLRWDTFLLTRLSTESSNLSINQHLNIWFKQRLKFLLVQIHSMIISFCMPLRNQFHMNIRPTTMKRLSLWKEIFYVQLLLICILVIQTQIFNFITKNVSILKQKTFLGKSSTQFTEKNHIS